MALARRRLYRSTMDRKLAGVCGGVAEFFDIDPTLVRVGFVLAALFGAGEVAYIVMWIVVPNDDD
jgi:phage shock protein PspC (stress-responsive transcriptional regulator)